MMQPQQVLQVVLNQSARFGNGFYKERAKRFLRILEFIQGTMNVLWVTCF
jgi:hypothetical protein